jgi:hypothetical protein
MQKAPVRHGSVIRNRGALWDAVKRYRPEASMNMATSRKTSPRLAAHNQNSTWLDLPGPPQAEPGDSGRAAGDIWRAGVEYRNRAEEAET